MNKIIDFDYLSVPECKMYFLVLFSILSLELHITSWDGGRIEIIIAIRRLYANIGFSFVEEYSFWNNNKSSSSHDQIAELNEFDNTNKAEDIGSNLFYSSIKKDKITRSLFINFLWLFRIDISFYNLCGGRVELIFSIGPLAFNFAISMNDKVPKEKTI